MGLNPYLAVIIAATIGGFNGVIVKWANLGPIETTFIRLAVPTILLFIYLKSKNTKIIKGNWQLMFLASFFNTIRLILYYLAFLYTSVGNAIIILFSWPIFAAIWNIIWLKQKRDKKSIALILVAFVGIIFMYINKDISFSNKDYLGMIVMLGSAIVYSFVVTAFKKESNYYTEAENIFYQNVVGAILIIPVLIFTGMKTLSIAPVTVTILYQGIITGVLAFLLFFYGLKRLKMNHYSLFSYWEVPASIIAAIIFLGEKLTWNMTIGGLLIVASGLGLLISKNKLTSEYVNS